MITDSLKKIYSEIHANSPFGKRAKFPKYLQKFIEKTKPKSILDFGCGKGRLLDTIRETYPNITVIGYDPANPDFDIDLSDVKVDLIISSDVLEHIEPDLIVPTLETLRLKSKYFFHLIACSPAKLILPDGRNAHLIIEDNYWWNKKFVDSGYRMHNDYFLEFTKIPKGMKKPMQIKKYFVMGETNGLS